jgi:hypothetical protein
MWTRFIDSQSCRYEVVRPPSRADRAERSRHRQRSAPIVRRRRQLRALLLDELPERALRLPAREPVAQATRPHFLDPAVEAASVRLRSGRNRPPLDVEGGRCRADASSPSPSRASGNSPLPGEWCNLWTPVGPRRRCGADTVPSPKFRVCSAFSGIGETGFEPATARPPAGCATRLRHSP